jgi:hypothetical protein
MLDFVGTDSYKYAFKIPKEETWAKKGYIEKLTVYRKGKLGLKYHDTGFFSGYESKKYLVIYRNPLLRNRSAVNPVWSDIEPKRPSGH